MARLKANTNDWEQVLKLIGEEDRATSFLKPKSIKNDYLDVFLNQTPSRLNNKKNQERYDNGCLVFIVLIDW